MEYLDRGLVALKAPSGVYLSWRMLGTDPEDVGFLIYRNGSRLESQPYTATTNYTDYEGSLTDTYFIRTVINNSVVEVSDTVTVWPVLPATESADKPGVPFKRIPLPDPPVLEGTNFTPGDMSVGDLDGDGDYELVYEWEPDNYYNPFIDAIDLDGNFLWRINCGPNTIINDLAFLVYDMDLDGKAELAMKTGPGTMDGTGNYLATGPAATDDDSHLVARVDGGHLMEDPAYMTVFNGETGAELATTEYWPPIGPISEMEEVWGDNYGKRSGSIKSAVLYNDEIGLPVMVFTRGIYTRIGMGAYTWDGEELQTVWQFDTENPVYHDYEGQGNHSVAVGDVDGDGSDELIYGACAIDHDGTGLYNTRRGHGDSHHLGDLIPDHPGMEYFQPHENSTYGITMRDAATGEILWEYLDPADVGRAWAADVDPAYPGSEIAAVGFPNYDCNGDTIPTDPASYNAYYQPIYFDGDVQRELRKETAVNGMIGGPGRIVTCWYYGASTVHSTKEDANLVADIIGDWREEMIFRKYDNSELLLFTTWLSTSRKNYTLMHDPTYRMNVVVQNIGYNQPANVGYYFPDGAPVPNIEMIKYFPDTTTVPVDTSTVDTTQIHIGVLTREREMELYPNPASSLLHVTLPLEDNDLSVLEVFNLAGEKIYQTRIFRNETVLNLDGYNKGIYLLRVTSGKKAFVQKFVISG